MNRVIRVRTANNKTDAISKHFTLTRVVNEPEQQRVFGHAISDDGEQAYIPGIVVKKHNMTEHDVGAGFSAPTVDNPRHITDPDTASIMVQLPIKWDGGVEAMSFVELPDDDNPTKDDLEHLETEFSQLADHYDKTLFMSLQTVEAAIKSICDLELKMAIRRLEDMRTGLCEAQGVLHELAPESDDQ